MMILIKKLYKLTSIFFILLICSCETLEELTIFGDDTEFDDSFIEDTPELVLPPDFGKVAKPERPTNQQSFPEQERGFSNFQNVPTVYPNITNYIAPRMKIPSSPTPSDSIEKFKKNNKFTIGEWVYKQYVDGFKQGNVYYRPIYDKGYNFSRKYVPSQNVFSYQRNFSAPLVEENSQIYSDSEPLSSSDTKYHRLDELPIIE